jgi:CDP-glycerol glycerophosphotransferase
VGRRNFAQEQLSRVRKAAGARTRTRTAVNKVLFDRYARWHRDPIRERTVLYEAFGGNGALDNPEAIFRYLLSAPDMADLEHVWALHDASSHADIQAEFADHPQVRFVEVNSAGYFKALATSKYLFNNATFQQRFAKRPEQVYVNTWHGVPLKHMGVDMPRGGPESRNITRNFLNADYLLSANRYMTDTMYRDAYRMQGIFRGAVLEEGQPRADRLAQGLADPDAVRRLLEERGVRVGDRRIVVYAPTWRGERFGDPWVNASQLMATTRELQETLDPEKHVVLLKVHQVIYDAVKERVGDCDFLVPNSVPTNLVLAVSDVLVTDYSSIFFDFVPTGRPVVHYVPDLDEYRSGRGLYLTQDELPGPVCSTAPDLHKLVSEALAGELERRPADVADHPAYAGRFDGGVCERVVDVTMRGKDESDYNLKRDFGTDKPTVLVYLGSMKSQGITTSALNLLRHIDHDTYDVTAFYPWSRGRERAFNIAQVDPRVRVVPRQPVFLATQRRMREETKHLMVKGLPDTLSDRHVEHWTVEWQRMFGSARFDHLVDFSGYGCYAPFLFSVVEAKTKSIWLHNDMYADMQRDEAGQKHLEDRLAAVFSTYKHFDHLVSVSRELDRVNRERLSMYARPEQFTYAHNTMDAERVLRMAGVDLDADDATGETEAPAAGTSGRTVAVPTDNIAAAVTTLLEHYTARDIVREARGRLRLAKMPTSSDTVTFVSVGRLSPAKNHRRLIQAFSQVHEKAPHTRLVIVGGGALEGELNELVLSLGLTSAITLAGQVDNPYAIMADASCFVLSSDYEGQPMVILEARTLGLPVVTTSFGSVKDSVPEDAGVVVEQSDEGIARGMMLFLEGKVPAHTLDHVGYNREAIEQFYAATGLTNG